MDKKTNLSDHELVRLSNVSDIRVGIVVSKWNPKVTDALSQGAKSHLIENNIAKANIEIHQVPGSFELPLGAQWLIETNKFDAVICLGCVIQGETRHFDFISSAVAQSISDLSLKSGIPVIFGVLTTDTVQQAYDRSGGAHGNKGIEAAATALEMIMLKKQL